MRIFLINYLEAAMINRLFIDSTYFCKFFFNFLFIWFFCE